MLNHYKGFHAFPRTLRAKVVEVETLAQTGATRKALQPLSHVPITAEFRLVEVDLSPLLPAEALVPFKEELAARAARRARERAREKREAARAAAAAAAKARKFDMREMGPMPLPHEVRLDPLGAPRSRDPMCTSNAPEAIPPAPTSPCSQQLPPSLSRVSQNRTIRVPEHSQTPLQQYSPRQSRPSLAESPCVPCANRAWLLVLHIHACMHLLTACASVKL